MRDGENVNPGAADIERLLSELSDLRLMLDSDLTIAAAALDCDSPQLASEILEGEHAALVSIQARVLRGLPPVPATNASASAGVIPISRHRRFLGRLPAAAAPAVAAAAVAIAVLGATALPALHSARPSLAADAADVAEATNSYDAFSRAAGSKGTGAAEMQAAATALHASLGQLIAAADDNPESAKRALELLQAEQFLLLQSKPAGAAAILREAHQLVLQLRAQAPHIVSLDAAQLPTADRPSSKPTTKAKPAAASPSPTATKSPSPSPSPSKSPSPTPTPSKSPNPSSSPEPEPTLVPGI